MTPNVEDPARLGETRLPDGRVLGWAEWGPADGTPVLLCPGAATGRRLGLGPDAVRVLGVRLISVDRPGLGASTPAPGRTFAGFARIPGARRHTVPDAGGSLLWTHPVPVLTGLLTRTGRATPHSSDRHRPSAAPE